MKRMRKLFLIGLLTVFSLLCVAFGGTPLTAKAETQTYVTASTSSTLQQGNTGYCYVYIQSLENISTLNVSAHFDESKVRVDGTYNSVSCAVYDSAIHTSDVQYSYIFNNDGQNYQTRLFYFNYTVLSDAEVGESYFDIVVNEAYDATLNVANVSGSRCYFSIEERTETKSCSIYGSSTVNTAIREEFSLSYRVSSYEIASGSFVISYNDEFFEVVGYTLGGLLTNKVVDVNTSLAGSIYLSFVGTEYAYDSNLLTVQFKTVKNVTESSAIKLTVTEFYDLQLNKIFCGGYSTQANVAFDETYTGDSPCVTVVSTYSLTENQTTVTVKLDKDSHLGAGDFVLRFDPEIFTYRTYEKGFAPSFFNVNDKNASEGELKFSIISMSDIVSAETMLTVTFDTPICCFERTAEFTVSGTGLADSLTNPILLNFVDSTLSLVGAGHDKVSYEAKAPTCTEIGWNEYVTCSRCDYTTYEELPALGHTASEWITTLEPTCTTVGSKHKVCTVCDAELEVAEIAALGHDEVSHSAKAPTCTEIGWNEYETCSRCDYTTYEELPALGHTASAWITTLEPTCTTVGSKHKVCTVCSVELEVAETAALGHDEVNHEAKAPTCTEIGWNEYETCTRCDYTTYEELPALGHTASEWITTLEPTCTTEGSKHKVCTVCNEELEVAEIAALGHDEVNHEAKAPTCTEIGWNAYETCTRCDYTTYEELPALGHTASEWIIDKQPTETEEGLKHKECTICGENLEEETIEKEGLNVVEPSTTTTGCSGCSANSSLNSGIGTILASLFSISLCVMCFRKKNEKVNKN